ncbi:hypothetical protein NE619_05485 [Anaerovorax odorimutans]|uniref:DUF4352 domain-containing protein n=1 Tax=Anaerovorax odorimutans TaxID=109327 RepID=A0ABT1RLW8_9FIRM|nr:hypothetical protein [Anaerovorax odorimutans]MCQ4636172.1 hypothetical protein [Anaerovorax odorimutans]
MKKKSIALLLALAVLAALALSACGAEDISMKLGEKTVLEDYIEFTPINVLATGDEMYAPTGNESGWVYNGELEDPAYVALVAKVKNLSKDKIKMQNFVTSILKQGEKEYDTYQTMLLTENNTLLSTRDAIEPGQEGTVYILMDGEQSTRGKASMEMTFTNSSYEGEDIYHLDMDTNKAVAVTVPLEKGKTVTADGYGKMTLKKVSTGKKVEPTKASKYDGYTYYTPKKTGTVLLDVQIQAENQQSKKCRDTNFIGISANKDNKTAYGYIATETKDGKNMKDLAFLKPGESQLLHAVAEVPKEWKSGGVQIYLYFGGQYYEYSWAGEK